MGTVRQFAGYASRSQARVSNNLGIIPAGIINIQKTFRKTELDMYDAYYESRQYCDLQPWEMKEDSAAEYIPVRKRQPKMIYNLAKVLSSRLASKLVGKRNFPTWKIEDDPETEDFFRLLLQSSNLRAKLIEPTRRCLNTGSVFVRVTLVNGQWKIEHFLSKWCFPEFGPTGQLEKMEVKYVYDDEEDLDEQGVPKKKWFKMEMGPVVDIMYDNPEFNSEEEEPEFEEVGRAVHGFGFVQGEWMVTAEETNNTDGPALIGDILAFIDEINYSLSQTSEAVAYNQDPQLLLNKMDEEEINQLIRSSKKAWNLGREGEANLLEASMSGVDAAMDFRDKIRLGVQDIVRIVMMDPEKMASHAQSGRSLEVLHGPFVELVEELQPQFESHVKNLMLKMALMVFIENKRGNPVPITVDPSYSPTSLNLIANFPPIFPQTMEDLQKKVSVATSAASANIISRETMTKWLAKDFGVEDIDEELSKIANQPVINPFGAF